MIHRSLIVYMVAGYPNIERTVELMHACSADVIELGIPFSDPVADGRTIQKAYAEVLRKGFRVEDTFRIIRGFRKDSERPVIIMSYYNPIYRMGVRSFLEKAAESGVDGILAVDLPVDEAQEYLDTCRDLGLKTIFLAAPNTSEERLGMIDETSDFIYLVSTYGVTGVREKVPEIAFRAVTRVKKICRKPVAVGFGVSKRKHVEQLLSAGADAVVVGSAVLEVIEKFRGSEMLIRAVKEFTEELNPKLWQ